MGAEGSFQFGDGDFAVVEYARGEGGVGPALRQDFLDVSDTSGATGGYHRDGKFLSKMGICLHGIAVLGAVIIH